MIKNNSVNRLPLTRKEQAKDIIFHEPAFLFLINFCTILCLIPLIALYFIANLVLRTYIGSGSPNETLLLIFVLSGLIAIPLVFLFEIATMGMYQCLKELVLESSSHFSSFFKGIKNNFKSFLPISLLVSILIGLLVINFGSMFYSTLNKTLTIAIFAINVILLTITLIIKPYYLFEASIFNNNFLSIAHNAFYFINIKWLRGTLLFLLTVVPFLLIIIVPLNYVFIPIAILDIGYFSISSTLTYLFYLDLFETHIEPEKIKEIYHKGLEN